MQIVDVCCSSVEYGRKRVDRPRAHLVVRERNGREVGVETLGDEFLVVETDDGDVPGGAETQ